MVDRNNLNRIKGILSARQGAEIPKYDGGAKFIKSNGEYNIYSNNWLDWFYDEALTKRFTGSPDEFADLIEASQVTAIPTKKSPNESVSTKPSEPAVVPEKVEAAKTVAKSFGMNLTDEEKQSSKDALKDEAIKLGVAAFQGLGKAAGAKQMTTDSNLTKGIDAGYDAVAGVVDNLGPVGKIVSTAMQNAKLAGDIIQEMGGGTDQQTATDKWMDSAFFSWNIGMLNGFAGKNSDSFAVDQDTLAQVGSSYGDTVNDLNDAASKANKKYGLFSSKDRKKANSAIAAAKSKQNLLGSIAESASDQNLTVQSMSEQQGLAHSIMLDGGYNQKYTYAAKEGGTLEWNPTTIPDWKPQIELNWELPTFKEGGNIDIVDRLDWIPEFKSGGKTEESDIPEIEETSQKNVIPEGALHKNKHHMEHAEGLTKKGIPVIDEDGEQQAEIEHSEIIFTLEVTKKLEEYYEIFYSEKSSNKEKEQAAIDAGKLLVYQILENTEDRTGLIESCKEGGSLTLKKTTDDLIEDVLDWVPTLVVVEEKEPEEKPKKDSKEKSEKEKIKEVIKEALIELLVQ